MTHYLDFSPEELAQDDFFIKWVKMPDLSTETFWRDWLETYPFKKEEVEVARHLVLLVHQGLEVSNTDAKEVKEAIFARIDEIEGGERKVKIIRNWYWAAAAILVGALTLGWYFQLGSEATSSLSYENQVKSVADKYELVEIENTSETQKLVNLPDGSSVVIKQGSKLSYPKAFAQGMREVILSGEAFFEISKNPDAPFFVKTSQITTKVLGTSFNVRAYEKDKKATVSVKTGKVAVYLSSSPTTPEYAANKSLEGLVLKPGERAIFEKEKLQQINSQEQIAATPILRPIEEQSFEFEETQLREVFKILEQVYQIDIEYDEKQMGSCPITASLTDEPLYEKLTLICKAVRADYKLQDRKIFIKGNGCQ